MAASNPNQMESAQAQVQEVVGVMRNNIDKVFFDGNHDDYEEEFYDYCEDGDGEEQGVSDDYDDYQEEHCESDDIDNM